MKYSKLDAKDYARENMKGIWAAAMNPFNEDFSFNEEGLRRNFRHWIDDLAIQGLFIAGKQGEFATMSLDERKRNMEIAVEECGDKAGTICPAPTRTSTPWWSWPAPPARRSSNSPRKKRNAPERRSRGAV